jgi:hypothetical protein
MHLVSGTESLFDSRGVGEGVALLKMIQDHVQQVLLAPSHDIGLHVHHLFPPGPQVTWAPSEYTFCSSNMVPGLIECSPHH